MDKFTKQLLGTKTQQDVTPNGFNQPRSRFYNSTIRNYWEQGGALAPIIPHLYESKGTPIYRDTTDSSLFENGGELLAQPYPNSFFASDLGNYYANGGYGDPPFKSKKDMYYTYSSSDGVYRKVGNHWEVDWNRSGNFQPLTKNNVEEREARLNKSAKPLYDKDYYDMMSSQFQATPKTKTISRPTTQKEQAAQKVFTEDFAVPKGPDPVINPYNYAPNTNAADAWAVQQKIFPESMNAVNDWYKNWYAGRMAIPRFEDIARQRYIAALDKKTPFILEAGPEFSENDHDAALAVTYLPKVNNPANKPYENKVVINSAVIEDDPGGYNHYYNSKFANPTHSKEYFMNEGIHEKSHWDENNFRQPGTGRFLHQDKLIDNILPGTSLINYNEKAGIYNENYEPDASIFNTDFKGGLEQNYRDYISSPTEIRARLNVWRQQNNINPTKNYSVEELQKIMNDNIKKAKTNERYKNTIELFHIIEGNPELLKKLNDTFVKNNNSDSDQLNIAKFGGELPKAQHQLPIKLGSRLNFADGGPLHDRNNTTGKLLNSTYASVLGSMFRDGGYFDRGYSLPEDSFRQGGRGLKDSIYASTSGQYPATYRQGGSILSMSNTPQLEGEGKDLNYPSKGYAYGSGGMLKRADGSYSKKGLWDYIRANKGSGKESTKEMLRQESKIRNEKAFGGVITTSQLPQANYFDNGGKPKNPKLITYKTDSKLIDGTAAFDLISKVPISDDYNQQIKERLYTGKWGFDPESGALVKLNKSQQTTIPQNITNIRKEEKITEEERYRQIKNEKINKQQEIEYLNSIKQAGFNPSTFGGSYLPKTEEYKEYFKVGPRSTQELQKVPVEEWTKEEMDNWAREGYNATMFNPLFSTAAYFTPAGIAIGAIQGAANLIPDLYEGDYGYAAMDVASMLPFARPITQKAKSAIQNTYKINPWAFKPNPEAYYRGVGKEGMKDILQSGIIRSKKQHAYPEPYFSKGVIGDKYAKGYFAELVDEPMKGVGSFPEGSLIQTPSNVVSINNPNLKLYQKDWLRGYKEIPKSGTKNVVKAGSGGMDMSRYEIANPDYFTQLLDTYTSKQLPPSSKKFYKGLIASVKKQDGIVTERQYQELQRLKTGNFNYGPNTVRSGIDANFMTRPLTMITSNELTPGQQWYRKIGNEKGLQDLIDKQGAQAPGPMRMKSGAIVDAPFFGKGNSPVESYRGLYAVELKPEARSKYNMRSYVGGVENYGSVPFADNQIVKNVPLEDLNVYRKKFLSNNYKQLDPNNLEAGLKNAALQRNVETGYKWGVRGLAADQIFNDGEYTDKIINATGFLQKKQGGKMHNAPVLTTSMLLNRFK
jgi:hypothetical protein